MSKVALIIIFNHNYEANLERLEEIYGTRFSDIWFVMPFYQGQKANVITVYDNSFYFQGYIANALKQLQGHCFDHYFFIGDDLFLNPEINEKNYIDYFKVNPEQAFLPDFFLLNDLKATKPFRPLFPFWGHERSALELKINQRGLEGSKFLPSREDAITLLKRHNLNFTPRISRRMFFSKPIVKWIKNRRDVADNWERLSLFYSNFRYIIKGGTIPYPLVGSYSDIVIVPHRYTPQFGLYCGIFSALRLFVEIGLPTALAFSVPSIVTETDLNFAGITYWRKEGIKVCEDKYKLSLSYLIDHFPENALYIHPIKLSKWK